MPKNIWCVSTRTDETGHAVIGVFPIRISENIVGRVEGYESVFAFETKKNAYETARCWEQAFRENEMKEQGASL